MGKKTIVEYRCLTDGSLNPIFKPRCFLSLVGKVVNAQMKAEQTKYLTVRLLFDDGCHLLFEVRPVGFYGIFAKKVLIGTQFSQTVATGQDHGSNKCSRKEE